MTLEQLLKLILGVVGAMGLSGVTCAAAGCAANTETLSDQRPVASDETTTDQGQATQGSYVTINVTPNNDNDPRGNLSERLAAALSGDAVDAEGNPVAGAGSASGLAMGGADGGSAGLANTRAGHVQLTYAPITVTTGGTTPTQTGDAAGSAAATGTTTQSAQTDQTIKAAVEAAVQAALQGQQHGGQAGVEGTQSTANQQQAEFEARLLKAAAENPALRDEILKILAGNAAASGPASTQPAGDDTLILE